LLPLAPSDRIKFQELRQLPVDHRFGLFQVGRAFKERFYRHSEVFFHRMGAIGVRHCLTAFLDIPEMALVGADKNLFP